MPFLFIFASRDVSKSSISLLRKLLSVAVAALMAVSQALSLDTALRMQVLMIDVCASSDLVFAQLQDGIRCTYKAQVVAASDQHNKILAVREGVNLAADVRCDCSRASGVCE